MDSPDEGIPPLDRLIQFSSLHPEGLVMGATTLLATTTPASDLCMQLLAAGVPLSLLCDLTDVEGPSSRDVLDHEGRPQLAWWAAG